MKAIIIIDVDPDVVMNAHAGDCEETLKNSSLEGAITGELGWVAESGISVDVVICEDSFPNDIPPNDSDLGSMIRKLLTN